MSILKKPFRIELRKTAVVVSYRAYLVGVCASYIHVHCSSFLEHDVNSAAMHLYTCIQYIGLLHLVLMYTCMHVLYIEQ